MSDRAKTMLVEVDRVVQGTTLNCTHEEADMCMLFHAAKAVKSGFERIVIVSPDIDVLILMVHFTDQIGGEVWFKPSRDDRCFSCAYHCPEYQRASGVPSVTSISCPSWLRYNEFLRSTR